MKRLARRSSGSRPTRSVKRSADREPGQPRLGSGAEDAPEAEAAAGADGRLGLMCRCVRTWLKGTPVRLRKCETSALRLVRCFAVGSVFSKLPTRQMPMATSLSDELARWPPRNLALPAIADVDLPVGRLDAVPDDEVVGEAVLHAADAPMVMLHATDAVVAVGAVVDDDVLPAVAPDARPVDLAQSRTGDGGRLAWLVSWPCQP